jgi:TM2 domain-containing membrane protein YozV
MVKPNFCSNCGEKFDTYPDAGICPKCHTALHEHPEHIEPKPSIVERPKPSIVEHLPYKNPGTAALIAFIGGIFGLPGIGHMYVGKVGKGIGILILGLILYAVVIILATTGLASLGLSNPDSAGSAAAGVFGMLFILIIVYIVFFLWQIFNARKMAKKFNEIVRTTGKEPW